MKKRRPLLKNRQASEQEGALQSRFSTYESCGKYLQHQEDLCFADDTDGLAGEKEELADLVEHLDKASTDYGMEISAEKTKLMKNNASGINT